MQELKPTAVNPQSIRGQYAPPRLVAPAQPQLLIQIRRREPSLGPGPCTSSLDSLNYSVGSGIEGTGHYNTKLKQ
jgi:hypothetical protein